jgi:hypothetical protein
MQDLERLAHWDDADAEAARDIVDDEAFVRLQLARQDGTPEGLVDELLFRPVTGVRRGR